VYYAKKDKNFKDKNDYFKYSSLEDEKQLPDVLLRVID
jgi:hypothetical protein